MSEDDLLIWAAIGNREQASDAWHTWSRQRDMETLRVGQRRLLPLIYRNLLAGGVAEADIAPVLRDMYRHTWIRNRLLFSEIAPTFELLASKNIDALLIKGAALVAGYYHDTGIRPMLDFDLLVRPAQVAATRAALEAGGWKSYKPFTAKMLEYRHATLFLKGHLQCDLHWRVLQESRNNALDAKCFASPKQAKLEQVPVRIPRPEHQLMHTLVHGTRKFEIGSSRWIIDAVTVLRSVSLDFDWQFFHDEVQARGLQYPVSEALSYLRENFVPAVPADVIATLRAAKSSRLQRTIYRVGAGDVPRSMFTLPLYFYYLGRRQYRNPFTAMRWAVGYIQHEWKVDSITRLPMEFVARAGRRLKHLVMHSYLLRRK